MRRWLSWLAACGFSLAAALAYLQWLLPVDGALRVSMLGNVYELLAPAALGFLWVSPVVLLASYRSLADLPGQQRVLSALFRLGLIGALTLALAQPVQKVDSDRVSLVALVDVSDSVSDAALREAGERIEALREARRETDDLRLITFAARPRLVTFPPPGEPLRLRRAAGAQHSETDLQAALQLAYGVFPAGHLRRVLVLSDGVETRGDLLAEAGRASRFGVRVSTAPYRSEVPAEVAVRGLDVPSGVKVGQPFSLVANLYSSHATQVRARLYQGAALNGLDGVRTIDLSPGRNRVEFRSVVRVGGPVSYRLALDQVGEDRFEQNNQFATSFEVPGRPTVLLVEGRPSRARHLASALAAQQFDVDVRSPAALPRSISELERHDFLVLSNVPAKAVSATAQTVIERYVRDLGGGLLFAGGDQGYGLGGWEHTTVARMLPVRMQAEKRREMPGVAMALVIDRSGSMTGLPIEMAKAACRATVETLRGDDLVEVIAFDSRPKRFVKMQPARYHTRIQNELATIQPGGGTAIFPALDAAYQDISVVQARKKHVILLTDGRADSEGTRELVGAMVAEGITVTTVGLGDGADADFLRVIAEAGGGRYHHAPDENSLPRIFTRETEMITRQAAVQDWFPVRQTARADFLRGISLASAPLLRGYVATQLKPSPAQQILESEQGEPLLSRWRVGLGHVVAWTSDFESSWGVDWLRWRQFGRFIGQLTREHMRKNDRRELAMQTRLVADGAEVRVDSFRPDGAFDNAMESRLVVTGPLPEQSRRELPLRQLAPGRYGADFRLEGYGSFLLRATHSRRTAEGTLEPLAVSFGQVTRAYPREYERLGVDELLLRRVAEVGGGRFEAEPSILLSPGEERVSSRRALWSSFAWLAMVLLLLDLAMRRVRIFDRAFRSRGRAPRAPAGTV